MHAEFALIDQTLLRFVNKLDRIFDGNDMALKRIVQIVHHRGQRRRLTGSRWSGHQNQAFLFVTQLPQNRRHAEFFQRKNRRWDISEDRAEPALLDKDVDAEPRDVPKLKGKVTFTFFFEGLPLSIVHHVVDQRVCFIGSQRWVVEFFEITVNTDHRGLARADMTIGRAFFDRERQQLGNIHSV